MTLSFRNVIFIIIVALIAAMGIKIKYDSKKIDGLNQDLGRQEVKTEIAVTANKELTVDNTNLEKSNSITTTTLADVTVTERKVQKEVSDRIYDKNKKIKTLQEDTTLDEKEKDKQTATAQINSIWDSYCSFNEDKNCQTDKG